MINRYGPCVGITLFKLGRRKIELWRCPAFYTIPKHSHELEDIELAFVKGEAIFAKASESGFLDKSKKVSGWNFKIWKTFAIPAGTTHWFEINSKPLWFINFSKWKKGSIVTSAAKDFKLTD